MSSQPLQTVVHDQDIDLMVHQWASDCGSSTTDHTLTPQTQDDKHTIAFQSAAFSPAERLQCSCPQNVQHTFDSQVQELKLMMDVTLDSFLTFRNSVNKLNSDLLIQCRRLEKQLVVQRWMEFILVLCVVALLTYQSTRKIGYSICVQLG